MENSYCASGVEALEGILDNFPSKYSFGEKDIERYILAFSFYLSAGDDGYRYHTDFLEKKHSRFQVFLQKAKRKRTDLKKFIQKLAKYKEIKQWIDSDPKSADKIRISVNDFCEGSLSGDVSLCKEASMDKAEWEQEIVTVHFCERTVSFYYPKSGKDMKRAVRIFLSLVYR